MRKLIEKFKGKNKVKKNIFYVPKENILIGLGGIGSFTLGDYNPYVIQVKEIMDNKDIEYKDSIIKNIRDNIKDLIIKNKFEDVLGKNLQSKLFNYIPDKVINNNKDENDLVYIPYISWITAQTKSVESKQYIHRYCLGEENFYPRKEDFKVLKKLYRSITKNGYSPEDYMSINSSFIQGTLLKDGWDFKCHISSGRHRAAVLAAIGYKEIPVIFYDNRKSMNKFRPANYHHILDIGNAENWLAVKNGIYPVDFIKKLFYLHFDPDENYKAKLLGVE